MYTLGGLFCITAALLLDYSTKTSALISSALHLVKESETLTSNINNICKTWIFAVDTREVLDDFDFKLSSENQPIDSMSKPRILLFLEASRRFETIDLNKERNFEDIVYSTRHRISKFTPSCQVVFIAASSLVAFSGISKFLVSEKYSRTHKDYLVLIGDGSHVHHFFNSNLAQEFRHKYSVTVRSSLVQVKDFCNPNDDGRLSLFGTSCNAVINGKHLRVSVVMGTPFTNFQNKDDGTLLWSGGVYSSLIQASSKKFNYTYQFFAANNKGASGNKKNGTWNGAVGDIFFRRAELAIGAGITPDRDAAVDFGVPLEWIPRTFFLKAPPLRTSWKAIFWPFDVMVWTLIVLTAALIVPAYYLSARQNSRWNPKNAAKNSSLGDAVGSLIGIFLEQSTTARSWLGFRIRFLIFMWMIFCLVMGAGYRSRLVNFLTFILPDKVPTTHGELLEENYVLFFRYYGGVAYRYAALSNDPVLKKITQRAVLINSSQECIVLATLTEKSACLNWGLHGDYATFTNTTIHVHQTRQLLVKSKDSVQNVLVAWLYRKLSPITETFDRYILQSFASGVYGNWQAKDLTKIKVEGARWLNKQKDSPINKKMLAIFEEFSSNPKPLPLSGLSGLFSMSGVLLLCGCTIWILELNYCFGGRTRPVKPRLAIPKLC
jgi:hypothetical protein